MSDRIEILRTISDINAPEFAEPFKFYSVGPKGGLHSHAGCSGKRYNYKTTVVTHEMPLRTAVQKSYKLCERCLCNLPMTAAQENIYDNAKLLAEIATKVATLDGQVNDGTELQHIVNWPNLLNWHNRHVRSQLQQQLQSVDANNGLHEWHERLLQGVAEHVPGSVADVQLEQECLRLAAIEVFLQHFINGSPRHAIDGIDASITEAIRGGNDTFGFYATKRSNGEKFAQAELRPLRAVAEAWAQQMRDGVSAETAAETILENKDVLLQAIGEPFKVVLRYCDTANKPDDDEDTWDYAERRWYEHMQGVATRALRAWVTHYNALLANTKPVLVACSRFTDKHMAQWAGDSSPAQLIASTLNWIVDVDSGRWARSALICHPVMASYVCTEGYAFGAHGSTEPIQLDKIPSEDDLKSVLSLWAPDDDTSMYRKFADAAATIRLL